MRNSAFSTLPTNSPAFHPSLITMTLCSSGRSSLVLTLVFGLVTVVSAIRGSVFRKSWQSLQSPAQGGNPRVFDGFVAAGGTIPASLARALPVAELPDHVAARDRME